MPSFLDRLLNVALAEDEAVNALGGGSPRETISGTVGRAALARSRWAPFVAGLLDAVFGEGHCATQAAKEQARRDAQQ